MRKALLFVALLAVVVVATPASAVIVPDASLLGNGNYKATYSDYSDIYWAAGAVPAYGGDQAAAVAGGNGLGVDFNTAATSVGYFLGAAATANALGANAPGTLENRSVFNVSTIQTLSSQTVWNGSSQQLSGMLYNLTLIGVAVNGNSITLDFGADPRSNPLGVGGDATGPGLAKLPGGTGGVLEVYSSSPATATAFGSGNAGAPPDPSQVGTFTPNAVNALIPSPNTPAFWDATATVNHGTGPWGPASWVEGAGGVSDSYPGIINGGSLWLSAEFIPFSLLGLNPGTGAPAASVLYEETLNLSAGISGSATGYADVVGGSEYPRIERGVTAPNGTLTDLSIGAVLYPIIQDPASGNLESFGSYSGSGFWPVSSQDPVLFDVFIIPEPATLSLLGFGLVGLLIRRRK